MGEYYGLLVTAHLLCAITFVGAVFFEVLVIEPIEKDLPNGVGEKVAEAIPRRVRKFMPVVVTLLFFSGVAMAWVHYSARPDFIRTKFGVMLTIKVALAVAVLAIFVASIRASMTGRMDVCRFRHTHRIVAALMLAIVLLAKGMFYF